MIQRLSERGKGDVQRSEFIARRVRYPMSAPTRLMRVPRMPKGEGDCILGD